MQRLTTCASIHAQTRWTFGCTRSAFDTSCMPSSAHTSGARHKLKGEIAAGCQSTLHIQSEREFASYKGSAAGGARVK